MEPSKSPACRHCGGAMVFATRISMPRQTVYRCESCKTEAWILDRQPAAPAPLTREKDDEYGPTQ